MKVNYFKLITVLGCLISLPMINNANANESCLTIEKTIAKQNIDQRQFITKHCDTDFGQCDYYFIPNKRTMDNFSFVVRTDTTNNNCVYDSEYLSSGEFTEEIRCENGCGLGIK